jgi:DNA primase
VISEDVVQKVKEANDIVDVISENVKLRRSGRYYIGLCPFHHEKSPSFTVTPDKQIYKCFGCGEAGNVVTFIMKNRNVSYTEAIEILASRVNIDITYDDKARNDEKDANDKYLKLNREAAKYFYIGLQRSNRALDYLRNRGIMSETIKKFGLGFAPDSWNSLMNYLKKFGYSELDLLNCGLVLKSEKGTYYDRFRNRIMFPIFDVRGKVIGFGGRVMDDSKPKYLNSPETKVFKKGTNLYGLNYAIRNNNNRSLIIVEGYMDCISLHQHGIANVVASLGTALTPYMAKLLKRYADKVIMSYDADTAGINATLRGLDILKKEGLDIRILTVPEGKDPDEYIRKNSKEAFQRLVDSSLSLIDYRLMRTRQNFDISNTASAYDYIKNAIGIIIELDSVERDIYVNKISAETGVKDSAIYDLMSNKIEKNVNKDSEMNSQDTFGQKLYLEPAYVRVERNLLKIMALDGDAYNYIIGSTSAEDFVMESHKKIFNAICDNMKYDINERFVKIEIRCDDVESSKEWVAISEIDLIYDVNSFKEYIDACKREIRKYQLEESKRHIMNKIKQFETHGKVIESLGLIEKLIKIQKEIGGM